MFELDENLEKSSVFIADLPLCQLRLHDCSAWLWLVLIPRRPGKSEVFDLDPVDQTQLNHEVNQLAAAVKRKYIAFKMNIAAFGNVVSQLHYHVIARRESDMNWPAPVWKNVPDAPYSEERKNQLSAELKSLAAALDL